jgi:hypothetical protein
MAILYISEYSRQALDISGSPVPVGQEPALAIQTVAIAGASAQSAALQAATRFVRLHTDAICSVKFGMNPVATTADARMAAGQTEFWGVPGTMIVATIANT